MLWSIYGPHQVTKLICFTLNPFKNNISESNHPEQSLGSGCCCIAACGVSSFCITVQTIWGNFWNWSIIGVLARRWSELLQATKYQERWKHIERIYEQHLNLHTRKTYIRSIPILTLINCSYSPGWLLGECLEQCGPVLRNRTRGFQRSILPLLHSDMSCHDQWPMVLSLWFTF